nr:MAG TPA: hypothetical protein [Crassvirales sp.]
MVTKKNIIIPIFRLKLEIVVVDDIKEALGIVPNIDTGIDSCVIDHNNGIVTIVIASNDMSIIAHECLHVKNSVWSRIGYFPQASNDEVDAYLLDYIMTEVLKVVEKHTNKTLLKI